MPKIKKPCIDISKHTRYRHKIELSGLNGAIHTTPTPYKTNKLSQHEYLKVFSFKWVGIGFLKGPGDPPGELSLELCTMAMAFFKSSSFMARLSARGLVLYVLIEHERKLLYLKWSANWKMWFNAFRSRSVTYFGWSR